MLAARAIWPTQRSLGPWPIRQSQRQQNPNGRSSGDVHAEIPDVICEAPMAPSH